MFYSTVPGLESIRKSINKFQVRAFKTNRFKSNHRHLIIRLGRLPLLDVYASNIYQVAIITGEFEIRGRYRGRHDIHLKGTQPNNTQHKGMMNYDTRQYIFYCWAECRYAECRYVGWSGATEGVT